MPQKKGLQTKPKGDFTNGSNANYAANILTQADKDAFLQWMSDAKPDAFEMMQHAADEAYRVTIKFDFNNMCYASTWTQQDPKHHNANLIVMSRAGSPEEAFWLSAYKIYELFPGERLPTQEDMSTWG